MKVSIITLILSLLFSATIWADEVELKCKNDKKDRPPQYETPIPVHVNLDNALLGIHFKKAKQVFVSVISPDGVIYQREVTSETAKSIYVDLAQYQNGEYNIYFQDAEGNEVSGEFIKEEE